MFTLPMIVSWGERTGFEEDEKGIKQKNKLINDIYVKKLKLEFGAQSKSSNSRPIMDENQRAGEMHN